MRIAEGHIQLNDEEARVHPFWSGFYPFVASVCGFTDYGKVQGIDCTKINISEDLQDMWFELAKEQGIDPMDLSMLLMQNGPKACIKDEGYYIQILPGAIV